ncbi:MAG: ATP-binding cassette domain-containing protein [Clostridiales bacterium]|uniref:ATP-binding cassette domain-containing protein n=1 Tax=Clostridium sp. N3C TaxID=1776758 RepID=UPI00092E005A|nr:ATP-binding cassette domain-containing protein [Clostridium sp. N3C]NLZ47625.1 ATP-binding cassette domain-containing protein [Clostridiales bacterium]SCN24594.1 putative ABC transporter ATP-binding protein YxlF [Clostridium sp. N3C]
MENIILKSYNLSKTYNKINALEDVNITIKKGQIYGFIGQNGAGKTTLFRIISGLSFQSKGALELFGESEGRKLELARRRMGCIIESPVFYPFKTAYENLEIDRIQKGIPGKECIEKALTMVGLDKVKNKKVRNFSLGMKQRLGIAMALLGDPEFLILDEPINGLDPTGIVEIREILKKLNTEYGVTILISSHILAELYQLANCYGIIHKGKLLEEITAEELANRCQKFLYIKVDDVAKASVIIDKKLNSSNFKVLPGNIIRLYDYLDAPAKVSTTLTMAGIAVEQITPMGDDLETYFSKLIGGGSNA